MDRLEHDWAAAVIERTVWRRWGGGGGAAPAAEGTYRRRRRDKRIRRGLALAACRHAWSPLPPPNACVDIGGRESARRWRASRRRRQMPRSGNRECGNRWRRSSRLEQTAGRNHWLTVFSIYRRAAIPFGHRRTRPRATGDYRLDSSWQRHRHPPMRVYALPLPSWGLRVPAPMRCSWRFLRIHVDSDALARRER